MTIAYSEIDVLLNKELHNIERTNDDPLSRYEKMARASLNSYVELKKKLKQHEFPHPDNEIHFFKNVHPVAISKVHYYTSLVQYASLTSGFNTTKEKKCHCKRMLKNISIYNANNQHVITYYKSGKCYLDEKYFLRRNSDYPFVLEDCLALADKDTSTGYDLIIARYLAYKQFSEFLLNEIKRFESFSKNTPLGDTGVFYKWTGSKSELIELMYGLYELASLNNSQNSLSELASKFEKLLQVDLGDYYHTFSDFKYRKNQTIFIDNLKKALMRKFDEKGI